MELSTRVLILTVLILLFAAPAVLAQELPPTAVEAVGWIQAGLAALAGLLAWAMTDFIKKMAWLPDSDRSKIAGPAANLVAAIVAVASGWLVGWLGQWAGLLDESGLWSVIVFAWPAAKAWYEATGIRKAIDDWVAAVIYTSNEA